MNQTQIPVLHATNPTARCEEKTKKDSDADCGGLAIEQRCQEGAEEGAHVEHDEEELPESSLDNLLVPPLLTHPKDNTRPRSRMRDSG